MRLVSSPRGGGDTHAVPKTDGVLFHFVMINLLNSVVRVLLSNPIVGRTY